MKLVWQRRESGGNLLWPVGVQTEMQTEISDGDEGDTVRYSDI